MQFLRDNYNAQEFQNEFKQNMKNIWSTFPLIVKYSFSLTLRVMIIVKIVFYISSFFTEIANDILINYPISVLFHG